MKDGPGIFSDISKITRAILYREYETDNHFSLTTVTADGVAITSNGFKKGDLLSGDVTINRVTNSKTMTELKVDTNSNVFATITAHEAAPGLTAIFDFKAPDQKSGRVELQYRHQYTGISTSISMSPSPLVNFSGLVGTNRFSVGTDLCFDTAAGNFTKVNAGLRYNVDNLLTGITLNDKGDSLTASYLHVLTAYRNAAVAAELTHSFSSNENTLTIGGMHMLDAYTTLKGKVNNSGKVSALLRHQCFASSFFAISGEVDTRAIEKSAKVGLSLSLVPEPGMY